ncbi:MAG: ketoacyl-ACP synthase III [Nitrospirae bacterium]|nr:ketoacyl-ACP synthase III [Nitrospirota bacterium]
MPLRTIITGTGSCLPDRVLTNFDLEKMVDTTNQWIVERTGISERRIGADGEATSDIGLKAARAAMEAAGVGPEDIDLIVFATITPDQPMPATACLLQAKLGARRAAAFDISAACSGFIYGLSIADGMIRSGSARRVLLVGAEMLSRVTDWQDRSTCVLFGDGAGAVVLEGTDDTASGVEYVRIHADGTLWDMLHIPENFIRMKGNETFKVAVRTLEALVIDTLRENNLQASDITFLLPHQANERIIRATAERLGLPMERVIMNLEKVGNTSGASIPIALDEAVRSGRIKRGDRILLEAFGAGLTWGAALIKW